jgi:hypothetical protein
MKTLLALALAAMVGAGVVGAEDTVTCNYRIVDPGIAPYNVTVDGIYKFWCGSDGCVPVDEGAKRSLSLISAAEGLTEILWIYEEAAKRGMVRKPEMRDSYQKDLDAIRRFREAVEKAKGGGR